MPKNERLRAAGLALLAAVVLHACGGGGSGGGDPVPVPRITTIAVLPTDVTLQALGATSQLEATARDQNGNTVSAQFSWNSSDISVVTVDAEGLVTAASNGMATVTVRSGSVSASADVTVEQAPASITLSSEEIVLTALGATQQLEASVIDANDHALSAQLTWASSDAAVATVDADGRITAQANGTVTVTASAGMLSDSTAVTVDQRVASVSLEPLDTSALDTIGATVQLLAIARDANGYTVDAALAWSSSDAAVATVDTTGLVTAQGDGMTEVTVLSGGYSDAIALDISLRQAATVVVTPPTSLLEAFEATVQLEAEVLDAHGQAISVPVEWTSSDPGIAVVNASGLIRARGNGAVTVTARSGEVAGTATVEVLQRVVEFRITPEESPDHYAVSFTSLGETVQFAFEALDANDHAIAGAVLTASSRTDEVVSIDEDFLAMAVANGETLLDFRSEWAGGWTTKPHGVRVRQVAARIDIEPAARTFRSAGETHRFTATARDANGHELPQDFLDWETADRRVAHVDASGGVTVVGHGETAVRVLAPEGLSASATVTAELQHTCASGDRTPSIASVNRAPLVEGASFTIDGAGFCPESAGNIVTVDHRLAAVEALSETRLSVTVPQFNCLPSRRVELGVAVGRNRVTRTVDLEPDELVVSVDVGRQAIWGAGEDKCLQFAPESGAEDYLIGVQSTKLEDPYEVTPVRLTVSTSEAGDSVPAGAQRRTLFWNARPSAAPTSPLATGHTAPHRPAPDAPVFEEPLHPPERVAEPAIVPVPADSVVFPDVGDIESLPKEGDIVTIPYPDSSATWVVYKVGAHALWLVDTAVVQEMEARHPGRVEVLSDAFDNGIYPTLTEYFGATDLGNIDRVVVTLAHFGISASALGASNRRWYRIRIDYRQDLILLAHEFTHVLQVSGAWNRAIPGNSPSFWVSEGQAQLGAEMYALLQSNLSTGQNYGRDIAFDRTLPLSRGWWDNFDDLTIFLSGYTPDRPHECSWLTPFSPSLSCVGASLSYPVGWSLQRWLSDQYGLKYPGGEGNLQRELIHGPGGSVETVEQQMGESFETLLARWAAAMYVDDRIPDLDPQLQYTSWNFYDIFGGHIDRIRPWQVSFSNQEHRARIVDGSFWYLQVSGSHRPATAIRVRDLFDRPLPDDIQVWVVRLQ